MVLSRMLMVVKSVFSLKAICLLGNCFFGCRIALAQACNEHAGRRGAITCGTIRTWLAAPFQGGMQLGVEPYLCARQACAEGQKTENLPPEILDTSGCLYSMPRFPEFMLKLGGAPMGKGSSK